MTVLDNFSNQDIHAIAYKLELALDNGFPNYLGNDLFELADGDIVIIEKLSENNAHRRIFYVDNGGCQYIYRYYQC